MLTVEVLSLPQVEGADVFVLTNNECGFISSYKNTMFNRNLEIYIKKRNMKTVCQIFNIRELQIQMLNKTNY